jgi:hypothetical protein
LKIDFLGLFDDLFCSIAVSLRWYLVCLPTLALAALDVPPLELAAADVAAVLEELFLTLGRAALPLPLEKGEPAEALS